MEATIKPKQQILMILAMFAIILATVIPAGVAVAQDSGPLVGPPAPTTPVAEPVEDEDDGILDTIRDASDTVWGWIEDGANYVWDRIGPTVQNTWHSIRDGSMRLWDLTVDWTNDAWEEFQDIWNRITEPRDSD